MSLEDKLAIIAENEQKVYDAGVEKGIADGDLKIWNMVTNKGARTHYKRAFYSTNYSGFTFPKPVKVKGSVSYMFYDYQGTYLPENVDFSSADVESTGVDYGMHFTFGWGGYVGIYRVYDMGWQAPAEYRQTFAHSRSLGTIERLPVKKSTKFISAFLECYGLVNITIDGEIGQNFDISDSTNLSHVSLMSIIDHLYDYASEGSTTTYTLTIGATNIAKLSSEELEIIEAKGWNYQ